jgi:hypothetical protein
MADRAQSASSKVVNRPHLLTVVLSLAAIALSLVSLHQSRMALRLNETTSRAVVQTTAVRLLSDWKWNVSRKKESSGVPIEMTFHNSGKSLSRNIRASVTLAVAFGVRMPGEETKAPKMVSVGVLAGTLLPDDIGPGVTGVHRITLDTAHLRQALQSSPEFSGHITDVFISSLLEYDDTATQGRYTDDSCFHARVKENGVVGAGVVHPCSPIVRGVVTLP